MGGAIIGGICQTYSILLCEQDQKRAQWLKRRYKVAICDLETTAKESKAVILAVKPQNFEAVLEGLNPYLEKNKLVISIAAGITCQYIEKRLGAKMHVVRAMPNLPVQVSEGMTGICPGRAAVHGDLTLACRIFGGIGKTIVVEEKWMDAVTALSGSGPAYVFLFIECLVKAADDLGLDEEIGRELVMQTIKGSVKLLEHQKAGAAALRKKVASKGGTTQAALQVFNKYKMTEIFKRALTAAHKRAKELSR
jgi:pyrroline-5-carboxylate reductase